MTDLATAPGTQEARLLRSAPYFLVADVERCSDYYSRVLGFRTDYSAGAPPQFAILSRDNFPIMLRRSENPSAIVPNEKQGGTWDVFFWVSDVESLYRELRAKSADIVHGPAVQPYGVKEIAVRDCCGYILGFGEAIAPK